MMSCVLLAGAEELSSLQGRSNDDKRAVMYQELQIRQQEGLELRPLDRVLLETTSSDRKIFGRIYDSAEAVSVSSNMQGYSR